MSENETPFPFTSSSEARTVEQTALRSLRSAFGSGNSGNNASTHRPIEPPIYARAHKQQRPVDPQKQLYRQEVQEQLETLQSQIEIAGMPIDSAMTPIQGISFAPSTESIVSMLQYRNDENRSSVNKTTQMDPFPSPPNADSTPQQIPVMTPSSHITHQRAQQQQRGIPSPTLSPFSVDTAANGASSSQLGGGTSPVAVPCSSVPSTSHARQLEQMQRIHAEQYKQRKQQRQQQQQQVQPEWSD